MSDGAGFTPSSSRPPGGGAGEAVACLRRAAEVLGEVAGADIPPGLSTPWART
ncbi:hypothetical protein [Nocardiopsis gilva]|uniref:hypothetical protein n=1 Tax=Nocardiopsis gilva TaxID=280236 RepID=UPI0012FD9184|nr:hypothetical protein [Nocardiopsis gilva]